MIDSGSEDEGKPIIVVKCLKSSPIETASSADLMIAV
jgi:hypothetical protein